MYSLVCLGAIQTVYRSGPIEKSDADDIFRNYFLHICQVQLYQIVAAEGTSSLSSISKCVFYC